MSFEEGERLCFVCLKSVRGSVGVAPDLRVDPFVCSPCQGRLELMSSWLHRYPELEAIADAGKELAELVQHLGLNLPEGDRVRVLSEAIPVAWGNMDARARRRLDKPSELSPAEALEAGDLLRRSRWESAPATGPRIRVRHDGRVYQLPPEHVCYRTSEPLDCLAAVGPSKYVRGEPAGKDGVCYHPVVPGQKLTPIELSSAELGERLLFYWPWLDLLTLAVGEVLEQHG